LFPNKIDTLDIYYLLCSLAATKRNRTISFLW